MGYLHIPNLYRPEGALVLQTGQHLWALEKVHGTSASIHITEDGAVRYHPGGVKLDAFVATVPDAQTLLEQLQFVDNVLDDADQTLMGRAVSIYGEAYGGSCQKMQTVYGDKLRFIVFDVKVDGQWLSVPRARVVADGLGMRFVPFERVMNSPDRLDIARDRPSEVGRINGLGEVYGEGIVLRPLVEQNNPDGTRCIAKHKRKEFCETKTPRVLDQNALLTFESAQKTAEEWVTPTRLEHVLDKLPDLPRTHQSIGAVIRAMVEDVLREGSGEVPDTQPVRQALGKRAAAIFKQEIEKGPTP